MNDDEGITAPAHEGPGVRLEADYVTFRDELFASLLLLAEDMGCDDYVEEPVSRLDVWGEYEAWMVAGSPSIVGAYRYPSAPSSALAGFAARVQTLAVEFLLAGYGLTGVNGVLAAVGLPPVPLVRRFAFRVPATATVEVVATTEGQAREVLAARMKGRCPGGTGNGWDLDAAEVVSVDPPFDKRGLLDLNTLVAVLES